MYTKKVAYFSMGSGIHNDFLTYSGGLEILAGDMIKEVIDSYPLHPITFFHLLWKKGYAYQRILANGEVIDVEPTNNNWEQYVEDTGKKVHVKIFGHDVAVKIWKLKEGPVYYLDTDLDENHGFHNITHHLYGGAWDNSAKERIAQEIVLGIGGVRAIEALGLEIDGYHYNDGHPAFAGIELISQRMDYYRTMKPGLTENGCFEHALKYVKDRTVFTTHTNVPAGNESHNVDLLMEVGANSGLTREQMVKIGGDPFGMTVASLKLSSKANGVSRIQTLAAKKMWAGVDTAPDIIAITNGVHRRTWQDSDIGKAFMACNLDGIYNAHQSRKQEVLDLVYEKTGVRFKLDKLTIIFARRGTEYKRGDLIAREEAMLDYLINTHGIQIIYAGKAHRDDKDGKAIIGWMGKISKKYPNNIVYLEGYDIDMAQDLVSGGDIWLNNPRYLNEACGTSGMKGAMNGTLNLTTADGWCREGIIHGVNGWIIGDAKVEESWLQDQKDAKSLMDLLINEIVPMYHGDKQHWKQMMFASIAMSIYQYSTTRMVEEYEVNLYNHIKV